MWNIGPRPQMLLKKWSFPLLLLMAERNKERGADRTLDSYLPTCSLRHPILIPVDQWLACDVAIVWVYWIKSVGILSASLYSCFSVGILTNQQVASREGNEVVFTEGGLQNSINRQATCVCHIHSMANKRVAGWNPESRVPLGMPLEYLVPQFPHLHKRTNTVSLQR